MSKIIPEQDVKVQKVYGKIKDITGQKLGELGSYVIGFAGIKNKQSTWYVKCYCGVIFQTSALSINHGISGCLKCGKNRSGLKGRNDVVGEIYGQLLILERLEGHKVFCKCLNCYNFKVCLLHNLTSGKSKTCGCSWNKQGELRELIGQKFGMLTALDIIKHKQTYKILCMCDCGNSSTPNVQSLRAGKTKSCGCIVQSEENIMKRVLSRRKSFESKILNQILQL